MNGRNQTGTSTLGASSWTSRVTARYWYELGGKIVAMEWRPVEDEVIPDEDAPVEEPDEPEQPDIEQPKTDEPED